MTTLITRIDQTMYAASDLQECANCGHKFLTANTGGRITRHEGGMTVTGCCNICGFDHPVEYVEVDHTIRYSFKSDSSVFNITDAVKCRGCRDGYLASEILESGRGIVFKSEGIDYSALTCFHCATVSYVPVERERNLQTVYVDKEWHSVAKEADCAHCDHHFAVDADAICDHDVSSVLHHCPDCGLENWLLIEPVFDTDEFIDGYYALTVVTHNAVIFKLPGREAVITHVDRMNDQKWYELNNFLVKCEKESNHYYMKL